MRRRTGQGKHFIITGHTIGSIKRNILDSMGEMFAIDCKPNNHGEFSLFGNYVHCFGTDKMDSYKAMTGMTAHGWYANEISLQHRNSVQEAFNRCSGEDAFIIWDTNPDYPEHPVKLNFIDHSDERLSNGRTWIKAWHFDIDDNPHLSTEYIENLKRSTPPGMWYDRAIKGLWCAAEGLVYEHFDREIHIIEPFEIPSDWRRVRGVDFGWTNPFVMLWGAVDHDGRLYIYDEHYKANMLIADHANAINKRKGTFDWTVADHDAQERAELHDCGIPTMAADKDVEYGIQKVAERLVIQPDGFPRLMIFGTCGNTISEFGLYQWEEQKEGRAQKEVPRKDHDHAMDCLRYLCMQLDRHQAKLMDMSDLGL